MPGTGNLSMVPYCHEVNRQRVILTDNGARAIQEQLAALNLSRAMVVCSPRIADSSLGENVGRALGDARAVVFTEVAEHPTLAAVERGTKCAQEAGVDCLVSLGGGSTVDLAKGIAIRLVEPAPLARLALNTRYRGTPEPRRGGALLPILALPTTLSGAECTPGVGLREEDGYKLLIRDPELVARVVILDPVANVGVPSGIMLTTGINAIAHCIEALYSRLRDPISDAYATQGLILLHHGLSAILENPHDVAARANALNGAHLAARAIVNARTGMHHAVCHVIGAIGVPHGIANAILLPRTILFNAESGGALLAAAERALCGSISDQTASAVACAVERLCERARLPRRLREVGVKRERIAELAAAVMLEPGLRFNPRQEITQSDVIAFLTAAW